MKRGRDFDRESPWIDAPSRSRCAVSLQSLKIKSKPGSKRNESTFRPVVFPPTHSTTILIRKLRIVQTDRHSLPGFTRVNINAALARVSSRDVDSTFPPPPFQTKHIREQVACGGEGQGELGRNGVKIVKEGRCKRKREERKEGRKGGKYIRREWNELARRGVGKEKRKRNKGGTKRNVVRISLRKCDGTK